MSQSWEPLVPCARQRLEKWPNYHSFYYYFDECINVWAAAFLKSILKAVTFYFFTSPAFSCHLIRSWNSQTVSPLVYCAALFPFSPIVNSARISRTSTRAQTSFHWPEVVCDPGHVLLEDRRGGAVHVPADQHVDGLGDLRRNNPNTSHLSSPPLQRPLTMRRLWDDRTGPMLMHLVKLSSAWMCWYSSLTALPLSAVLWWAS